MQVSDTVDYYYSERRTGLKGITNSVPDEGLMVCCGNGVKRAGMRELIGSVRSTILVNAEMGAEGMPLNITNCGVDFAQKAHTSPTVYAYCGF